MPGETGAVTLAVEDDFAGFVAARWPDLEAVALVATGDPARACEHTTRALAGLSGRWDEVLEEGAPTRAARAALLRDLLRPARPSLSGQRPGPPRPGGVAGVPPPPVGADHDDEEDVLPRRLVEALGQEEPLVRAALAAGILWQCDDAETAQLAGVAPSRLSDRLDTARARLLEVHRTALAEEGLSPADWRMERDLADALDALTAAQPDPPDPAGLVAGHARRLRRRSLLAGGAAVLATGGAAWWVLRDAAPGGEARAAAPTGAAGRADADVWSSSRQWPPRGALAGDDGVRGLVAAAAGPGARLLFAADVEGTRVVLAGVDGLDADAPGTSLRAWTGPVGSPPEGLSEVRLATDRIEGVPDAVAVALPTVTSGGMYTTRTTVLGSGSEAGGSGTGDRSAPPAVLVVLAGPTERSATWSPRVHPTVNGSVERAWTLVRMEDGVGFRPLDRPVGTAARVSVGDYDGPVAGAPAPPTTAGGLDPEAAASAYVARATGEPPEDLRSEVVVDSPVAGSVLDAFAMSATGGDGRVRLIHTTTPDGALVRTVHIADDGRSGRAALLGSPIVLAAADADEPYVRRLDRIPPRTTRYLVVAPGAARCHLLAVTPAAYPVSDITPMKGDTAIVPIINGQDTNVYRLVLWDADGRRIYDAVPERGRRLLDLRAW